MTRYCSSLVLAAFFLGLTCAVFSQYAKALGLVFFVVGMVLVFTSLPRVLGLVLISFTAGAVLGDARLNQILNDQWSDAHGRESIPLEFFVSSFPQRTDHGYRVDIVEVLDPESKECRAKVFWPDRLEIAPAMGQTYRGNLKLRRPRGLANPNGFDYHAWLLAQGYCAQGSVVEVEEAHSLERREPAASIARLRAQVHRQFFGHRHTPESDLLSALMLGASENISSEQWQVLRATGTSHLMAISGLHVGLVAVAVHLMARASITLAFLLPLLASRVGVWELRLHRALPAFASIAVSGAYAALSGFEVPAQRAWLMTVLFALAWQWRRRIAWPFLWWFAAIVCALVNPVALTQVGFWMSFLAVFCLFWTLANRVLVESRWRQLVRIQCALSIALLLPSQWLGLPIAGGAFPANLVAVPTVSLAVVPLLLAAAVMSFLSDRFALQFVDLAEWVMGLLWELLTAMTFWSPEYLVVAPEPWLLMLAVVGLGCLLRGSGSGTLLLALMIIVLNVTTKPHWPEGLAARIVVMDVGQGLAVLVEQKEHVIAYDLGAKFSPRFDIGADVIAPYLARRGYAQVDLAIISHGDHDHIGGLAGLQAHMKVQDLVVNSASFSDQGRTTACFQGQTWSIQQVHLRALWPVMGAGETQRNDGSCVIELQVGGFKMLLTGDIERSAEFALVASKQLPRGVDVVTVPHHGSRTSSSWAFLNAIEPSHAVVSAGYANRYGHPAEEVVTRHRELNITLHSTAESGALIVEVLDSGNYRIRHTRDESGRPWWHAQ